MPIRPNTDPQAKLLKHLLYSSIGLLQKKDIEFIEDMSRDHRFEAGDASDLIIYVSDLNSARIDEDKVREIALKKISLILSQYIGHI